MVLSSVNAYSLYCGIVMKKIQFPDLLHYALLCVLLYLMPNPQKCALPLLFLSYQVN
jgi:hypothetical protein